MLVDYFFSSFMLLPRRSGEKNDNNNQSTVWQENKTYTTMCNLLMWISFISWLTITVIFSVPFVNYWAQFGYPLSSYIVFVISFHFAGFRPSNCSGRDKNVCSNHIWIRCSKHRCSHLLYTTTTTIINRNWRLRENKRANHWKRGRRKPN